MKKNDGDKSSPKLCRGDPQSVRAVVSAIDDGGVSREDGVDVARENGTLQPQKTNPLRQPWF